MLEPALLTESDGAAALGICESLLLALIDLKIISAQSAQDLLADVIATHSAAAVLSPTPEKHRAVAEIVQRIRLGNSPSTPSE